LSEPRITIGVGGHVQGADFDAGLDSGALRRPSRADTQTEHAGKIRNRDIFSANNQQALQGGEEKPKGGHHHVITATFNVLLKNEGGMWTSILIFPCSSQILETAPAGT
jgi:hypothetical protein